jgi:glutathione S-transferase
MALYKLNYFDFKARGELIRLVFAAARVKYIDNRIQFREWPDYKLKSITGQCPFLEITETGETWQLTQSVSIARYLSRKFNLCGQDEREQAEVDMYADQITDIQNEKFKSHSQKDETRKAEMKKKFYEDMVVTNFGLFEKRLAQTKSGLFVNSGLSFADLYLFHLIDCFDQDRQTELLSQFLLIKKLSDHVQTMTGVAEYLNTRPVSKI